MVVVAALALAVLNFRSLKRLFRAGSAQAGKIGRWAENADPLAVYRERVDDGVENIGKAKQALENCQVLVRSVRRQVEDGEKEKARLENRIKTALANGDPNNTAKEYALQLERVERELATNKEQLAKHEETYQNFSKIVEQNQRKVQEARREAESLGLEL